MRKFQQWLRLRENAPGTVAPGTNQMSASGETPMPLAHAQGAPNPTSGGAGAGGGPNQGAGGEDETVLTGQLERHFKMFMADLNKLQRLNKAKATEILTAVMQHMQELGVQKNVATSAVKGAY